MKAVILYVTQFELLSIFIRMKKLIGLILFLNSLVVFSQPVRSRKLNLDHFTFREKKQAEEFSKLNRSSLNHPELGMMPFDGPACTDCIELIDRRDETSRYFVKEKSKGSKFIQQQASGAINFQDVNGFWREINYRLEKKNDKLFVAGNQPQPVSIDLNRNIITLQNSGFILKAEIPELIWRDEKGNDHSVGNADLNGPAALPSSACRDHRRKAGHPHCDACRWCIRADSTCATHTCPAPPRVALRHIA